MTEVHFVRVSDDSTREELAEAAGHLRRRQDIETDPAVRRWYGEDIDDILDLMLRLERVDR